MKFNFEISIGDIIALCSLIGSVIMFVLNIINQLKSKKFAQNANAYNESAKKYYDLAVEQLQVNISTVKSVAICDANIVKVGSNKWILKIFNKGNSDASDVTFRYLADEAPPIIGPSGETFPIKLLESQKNVDCHLIIHMGLPSSSWEYELTWKNNDGKTVSKKGVLTLPLS